MKVFLSNTNDFQTDLWALHRTITGTTTQVQSRAESKDNKEVTPLSKELKNFSFTTGCTRCRLMPYQGHTFKKNDPLLIWVSDLELGPFQWFPKAGERDWEDWRSEKESRPSRQQRLQETILKKLIIIIIVMVMMTMMSSGYFREFVVPW